ncbi:MAG: LVIVD repeat-containing protein [Polyangiales bacterium]
MKAGGFLWCLVFVLLACSSSSSDAPEVVRPPDDSGRICPPNSQLNAAGDCMPIDECLSPSIKRIGSFVMPDRGRDVVRHEDLIYMAAVGGGHGLAVLDVSDPVRAAQVAHVPSEVFERLAIHDGWLYALADSVLIFDITNPLAPDAVATLNPPGRPSAIAFEGDFAYTVAGEAGFRIYDVSDPRSPLPVGFVDTDAGSDVAVQGGRAYIAADSEVLIIDVSDPLAPTIEGSLSLTAQTGRAESIAVVGDRAYVGAAWGNSNGRLVALDVSTPSTPNYEGQTDLLGSRIFRIDARGGTLYAVAYHVGLLVYEITESGDLSLRTTVEAISRPRGIAIDDTTAYVVGDSGPLAVLDLSEPADPRPVFSSLGRFQAGNLHAEDGLLYVGTSDGLWILDTTDPARIVLEGLVELPDVTVDIEVSGATAYLALREAGLALVDVSDPRAPRLMSVTDTLGEAFSVSVQGSYAYVTAGRNGLLVVDSSDRENPLVLSGFSASRSWDVATRDGVAYLTDTARGLITVDVTRPSMPTELDSIVEDSSTEFFGITLVGDRAYVKHTRRGQSGFIHNGLSVIDISDPERLGKMERRALLDLTDVTTDGRYLYRARAASPGFASGHLAVDSPFGPIVYDMTNETIFTLAATENHIYGLVSGEGLAVFEFDDCGASDVLGVP